MRITSGRNGSISRMAPSPPLCSPSPPLPSLSENSRRRTGHRLREFQDL